MNAIHDLIAPGISDMNQPSLAERVAALEKHVVQLIVRRPVDADAEQLMAMSQPKLEERVAALEKHVVQLLARLPPLAQPLDWRSTVGMFANDEVMKQIDAEGRKIREADRRRTRRQLDAADRRERKAKRPRAKR
jgi:hypothetical protein